MKFALIVFETDASRAAIAADRDAYRATYQRWIGEVASQGKLAGGDALDTAANDVVSVRRLADGSAAVAAAPVHAGEETLGGWFVLDVADRDEAVRIAQGFPTPEALELRPLLESA